MHNWRIGVIVAALLVFAATVSAKTEVMVFFDAEDFTSDRANDTIRDLANLCTEEGVRDFRPKGGWILSPDFKDDYASDRLRWQFWTLRYND